MSQSRVYLLLVICVLIWSGNFIVGRYIHDQIEPLVLATYRWVIVAIVLFPFLLKEFTFLFTTFKNNFLLLNLLSILSVSFFNTFLYIALETTTATNALLINSAVPIEILLFSFLILKIKVNIKQALGIVLSMLGVVYLVIKGDYNSIKTLAFNSGDIWVFVAGISWAIYSVLMKFVPKELKGLNFLVVIVYAGLFWLLLVYMAFGYSFYSDIHLVYSNIEVFLYVSIFASIVSFIFWNKGVEIIGANKTGQFTHLMPIFGSILAYIFLGEVLEVYHIVGGLIIAFGIYLTQK